MSRANVRLAFFGQSTLQPTNLGSCIRKPERLTKTLLQMSMERKASLSWGARSQDGELAGQVQGLGPCLANHLHETRIADTLL